jgi:DNA-binding MarR family transcriptional regulator
VKQTSHYQQILRLVSGIGRLTNPQHLPVLKRMRISQAQFLVLDGLGEAGGPLRMADLARAARLSDSELTRVVNELEGKKWVERAVDPADGRAKLARMTPTGARLLHHAYDQAGADLLGVWEDFTHEEWHRFIDYLKRFEQGLRRVRTERESAPAHARTRRSSTGRRHA